MKALQQLVKQATIEKIKTGKPQAVVEMDSGNGVKIRIVPLAYTQGDEFEAFCGHIILEIQ